MATKGLLADLLAQQRVTNDLLRVLIDTQPKKRPVKKGT